MGHLLLRPRPPQIISREELADPPTVRRLERLYVPEESPLNPENDLHLSILLAKGSPVNLDDPFPNRGIKDSEILLKYHLLPEIPWYVQLVAQRPKAIEFATFAEYEMALMKWAQTVSDIPEMPPNATDLGEIIALNREGTVRNASPLPPNREELVPSAWMTSPPRSERRISKRLSRLSRAYKKFISKPPVGFDGIIEALNDNSYSPPFVPSNFTPSDIISQMCSFGVPVGDRIRGGLTQIQRRQRMIKDVGRMTDPSLLTRRAAVTKPEKLSRLARKHPLHLIRKDLSAPDFAKLLETVVHPDRTVASILLESMPLKQLISLSQMTPDGRFKLKFSFLMQHFLLVPSHHEQLLTLTLPQLEQFVELITYPGETTFPLEVCPDAELDAACDDDPTWISEIEMLTTSFRQTHLIHTLCNFVVSCSPELSICFDFIRELFRSSAQAVTAIVSTKTRFGRVLDGFYSSKPLVHQFYSRLLRIVVLLQYGPLGRALATHDLFQFIERGLTSSFGFVERSSRSISQLLLHTSTSFVFRSRIDSCSAISFVNQINQASANYHTFLLSCFCLFLRLDYASDFGPMVFRQFNAFVEVLTADLTSVRCVTLLCYLLKMCRRDESIFCLTRGDLINLVNDFARLGADQLLRNPNATKMRCLKILFKIDFIGASTVQVPELWNGIFTEMRSRQDSPGLRQEAWKTFRNALLHQPTFVTFLVSNPDLSKKLGDCFSSLDERVTTCMVTILSSLAWPLIKGEYPHLGCFWAKLSEPSVLIAGKIRSHYKSSMRGGSGAVRTALVDFVLCVLDALSMQSKHGEPLIAFITTPHIWTELSEMVQSIAELFDRKGMLFG